METSALPRALSPCPSQLWWLGWGIPVRITVAINTAKVPAYAEGTCGGTPSNEWWLQV